MYVCIYVYIYIKSEFKNEADNRYKPNKQDTIWTKKTVLEHIYIILQHKQQYNGIWWHDFDNNNNNNKRCSRDLHKPTMQITDGRGIIYRI